MSRTLCSVACDRCGGTVERLEEWRLATPAELGRYYHEYSERLFAHASCEWCGALYLAWAPDRYTPSQEGIGDLSYRSTFNNEPNEEIDWPRSKWVAIAVVVKAGPVHDVVTIWNRGAHAGTLTVLTGDGEKIAARLTSGSNALCAT